MKSQMQNSLLIREYIINSPFNLKEFAQKCNLSQFTVTRIIRTGIMRRDTAQKIEKGTNGELKEDDFLIKASRTKSVVK